MAKDLLRSPERRKAPHTARLNHFDRSMQADRILHVDSLLSLCNPCIMLLCCREVSSGLHNSGVCVLASQASLILYKQR